MNEYIKGYVLIGEFCNDNSGFSRWGFAHKDGEVVFIKEFLSPVYPIETEILSPEIIKSCTEICNKYVQEKTKLYEALNKCNTGNIVGITDFFRYKAKYYIVTEKVESSKISIADIYAMPVEQKHLICKIITHCVNTLHINGIVHGDIKHDNIIYKITLKGKYIAKLIDFDASFFENSPPDADEEFHGDMVYFAPESFLYIAEEVSSINQKIDIFALGLLFHQYFTGQLPAFDTSVYDYAFEAVLDGVVLKCNETVPTEYRELIESMLIMNCDARPSAQSIFDWFNAIENKAENVKYKLPNEEKITTKPESNEFGFYMAGDL